MEKLQKIQKLRHKSPVDLKDIDSIFPAKYTDVLTHLHRRNDAKQFLI